MIKYFCDICGKKVEDAYETVLPRVVRYNVYGGKAHAQVGCFDTVEHRITQICPKCEYKLAMALPIVEETN
jgi:hypothetical protein